MMRRDIGSELDPNSKSDTYKAPYFLENEYKDVVHICIESFMDAR